MNREERLNEIHQRFLAMGLGVESPELIDEVAVPDIMGYGTTIDEKITSLNGLRELIARQQEQSAGMQLSYSYIPVLRRVFADGKAAAYADDLQLTLTVGDMVVPLLLRFTITYAWSAGQWKAIHWHASKPENVQSDVDTFGIEEWKQKANELEKLVVERTADLVAKNRELEIEAALERVRTVAMAISKAEDMLTVCRTISAQLALLNLQDIRNVQTAIIYENKGTYVNYEFYTKHDKTLITEVDYRLHPMTKAFVTQMLGGPEEFFFRSLTGNELKDWFEHQKTTNQFVDTYLAEASSLNYYWYSLGPVALGISTYNPLSEQEIGLIKRFRNVFQLTYRRYLDIALAEAQAREATIEAALERVRARTMAMHSSDEFGGVAVLLFEQIKQLGVLTYASGFNIWDKDHQHVVSFMCNPTGEINPPFEKPIHTYEQHQRIYEAWASKKSFLEDDLTGEALKKHYQFLWSFPLLDEAFRKSEAAGIKTPERQVHNIAFFSSGYLLFITEEPCPAFHPIFERFANVFDLTYTRFNDLKQAEAQAREAQIEAALERVRSRTLAMQKSTELAETAAVLFKQLIDLGIAPNRLFIGIINGESGDMEAWATNEDGSKVETSFVLKVSRNSSVQKMYAGWQQQKKSIIIDMQGKELEDYLHYLGEVLRVPFKGGLQQKRRVQYIAYFGQGLIGIAAPDEQPASTLALLERFAAVFNLTYTRFNDLQLAEAHAVQAELDLIALKTAKKRAEDALTELKSTQKQLIQAEKMASLGELTAGIAHEIQNPLNFVNNFSEVSIEMLDELNQEMAMGNYEEVKAIVEDIKQNLGKINHHGKRADSIVKGMLQHSRISSGRKEPTDINVLINEYIRLSYHGLRAKDQSFNVTIQTDFDSNIRKINLISQDIGRVVLNVLNNAFYAVQQKQKQTVGMDYEPTVCIKTQKMDNASIIRVTDNGTGIPEAIRTKVFQPFFTTKPTGQGTGLGLSLSYDIVTKGHGGILEVDSKEGEGSVFTITLPYT
ncbi:ATP-binding protein [Spirosoma panaciterrae]|uniref:ATP-binding protein n=1 Tax=Spirosoma panaciterrae TaxID=496058 RepID=UPI00037FA67E|nr:ATP-binding protein [Spirosoma panaciterrae]